MASETLKVRCLYPSCASRQIAMEEAFCPPYLVSALVILFHAAHEGHPLEMTYEGKTWRSPAAPGRPIAP